jgi:hypothetical protein
LGKINPDVAQNACHLAVSLGCTLEAKPNLWASLSALRMRDISASIALPTPPKKPVAAILKERLGIVL